MVIKLSPQTIELLANIISGGSFSPTGYGDAQPIGIYRSGPKLERYMRECNVDFHVGSMSRIPALVECIERINENWHDYDQQRLTRILEKAADPRDFLDDPARGQEVLRRLNEALAYDDLQLVRQGKLLKLTERGKGVPIAEQLVAKVQSFELDTVQRDLERALESAAGDPEAAVTAACSTVESMCRSILHELGEPLPSKQDISSLYRAVRKPLSLSPEQADLPPEIAEDIRKVLSGLVTTIEGIGALRTHGGSAHGRTKGFRRIDARIARLAIHSAVTAATFILETWQRKYPGRELKKTPAAAEAPGT